MQSISANFSIAAFSRLILGGISLVIVVFTTRYLGPEGYGDYSAILAYLFLFVTLADLGLYTVLTREISKTGADEERIVGNIFTLRLAIILGAAILANLITFFLPYSQTVRLGILIASVFMVLSSLGQVLMGIFQKNLKIYWVSISDLVARLIQLGLVLTLVFIKAGFLYFILAVSISEIVHFCCIFIFANRLTRIRIIFDKKYWTDIIKTALPIGISLVFVLIYFKLDTFLLSIMKPSRDVGIYSAAYKIMEFGIFFPAAYLGLVMPVLSKHAVTNPGEFKRVFQNTFNKLAIFGWPVTFFAIVASGQMIALLGGGGFSASAEVLQILSLAMFIIFFGNLGGHSLVALNLQKKGMWLYMAGMVINLIGNLVLIPKYTYIAAAWTTVGTEVLVTVLMFVVIAKSINAKPEFSIFFKAFAAALLMAYIVFLLKDTNLLLLLLASFIYWPILYAFGGLSKKDIRDLLFWR
ncbi:MAG: flippase [bacterium]|nr:flippase [bacterium]